MPDVLLSGRDVDNFERFTVPEPNTGCLLWAGFLRKDGYGLEWIYPVGGKRRSMQVHRISYLMHRGQIPRGSLVLHSCDTPACVNPDHLRLGTPKDNMQDKLKRNRHHWRGITHCPKGHEYSGKNLKMNGNSRQCRTCQNDLQRTKQYWRKSVSKDG